MFNVEKVKKHILILALQGKLVEQRSEEGTGEELFKTIQAEKAQLIKEGKIKKEKPLPEIEKSEIPFEIPSSWKWVRLGNVIKLTSGNDLQPNEYFAGPKKESIPYITGASCISDDGKLIVNRFTSQDNFNSKIGDILLTCKGTIGKISKNEIGPIHLARQLMGINTLINFDYTVFFLIHIVDELQKKANGLIPGIDRPTVLGYPIPLPPLEEQKRIAAKLDDIFAELDKIDEKQIRLQDIQEKMKSKLLKLAFQGKLVEQRSEEGTGEELFKTIQAEKAQLIKEGKIKKEKPLPEIEKSEIPFEIPSSWKWVRLASVIDKDLGGGTPSKAEPEYWTNGTIPWITVKDFSSAKDGFLSDTIDHITEKGLTNSATNLVDDQSIILCVRMALGKAVRVTKNMTINQDLRAVWLNKNVDNDYFLLFYSTLNIEGRGMTVSGIKKDELFNIPLPLPPFEEQKRIAGKLNELLPICKSFR